MNTTIAEQTLAIELTDAELDMVTGACHDHSDGRDGRGGRNVNVNTILIGSRVFGFPGFGFSCGFGGFGSCGFF